MRTILGNDRGYAMVIAMAFITALGLLAVIIVGVASTEKQTTFNETTHARAFYSADAGGEEGINWLVSQGNPPTHLDNNGNVHVPTGYTPLYNNNSYKYDIQHTGFAHRLGYDINQFVDYRFDIDSDGASVSDSQAEIEVQALRLYKKGY